MLYSIAWQEFIPIERMNILKDLVPGCDNDGHYGMNVPSSLSSGELEAKLKVVSQSKWKRRELLFRLVTVGRWGLN